MLVKYELPHTLWRENQLRFHRLGHSDKLISHSHTGTGSWQTDRRTDRQNYDS